MSLAVIDLMNSFLQKFESEPDTVDQGAATGADDDVYFYDTRPPRPDGPPYVP